MQISSRFTVALHIFACIEAFGDEQKLTSDFLAASVNTNPVVVRKILSQLKKAGLVDIARGTGGVKIAKELCGITFYDVYEAVEAVEGGSLFRFHEQPNPKCPVGRSIHTLLDGKLEKIQSAMEEEMKKYTLESIAEDLETVL